MSAVGLSAPQALLPVSGIRIGTAELGGRAASRDDLMVVEIVEGARCAAVFTRNAFCAAPVHVAREHLGTAVPRFLLVNAGNANAGTGARGLGDARACCRMLAEGSGCAPEQVLPFSTGVIGEHLDVERFGASIPAALGCLDAGGWLAGARAIMTTDTLPKGVSRRFPGAGGECCITGIAKGAGMIRPDMATLLVFIATDACLADTIVQPALQAAMDSSFNRVTIDGDTSTNDACVLVATGRAGMESIDSTAGPAYAAFREALDDVCLTLAQAIVRDAEGATKFVTVEVGGGAGSGECLDVAYAIAHSPLVKTALYASDANYGRILAVVGRAGVNRLDPSEVSIWLNEVCVVEAGQRCAGYREEDGQRAMSADEIHLRVHLGRGGASETVWTCDLSHEYVTINAEYRT